MPVLMPASLVLGVAHAVGVTDRGPGPSAAAWAAASLAAAVTTGLANVPIKPANGRWDFTCPAAHGSALSANVPINLATGPLGPVRPAR